MARKQKYQQDAKPTIYLKPLSIKNSAQEHYVNTLRESTITFCSGPAGTGKTFIACHVALEMLLEGEVGKIILTRPIVATEDIGYLPGTQDEKIDPYMMPLYDAIEAHVGAVKMKDLRENGKIEVRPLAFLRGSSLNNAVLILDEAQNCTKEQMRMFLTRIGYGSRIIVTGDGNQSDLPPHVINGFNWAFDRLRGATGEISVVEFSARNIVRNPLIETMLSFLDGPNARDIPALDERAILEKQASIRAANREKREAASFLERKVA